MFSLVRGSLRVISVGGFSSEKFKVRLGFWICNSFSTVSTW